MNKLKKTGKLYTFYDLARLELSYTQILYSYTQDFVDYSPRISFFKFFQVYLTYLVFSFCSFKIFS